jgi:hypothetical protein
MISDVQKSMLYEASRDISNGHWTIGEIASDVVEKYDNTEINILLREVGRWCGLSWRRVDKIRKVYELFVNSYEDNLPFGYYERAYDFGEDAHNAIEFIHFFEEEYGRRPSMSEFPMLFTQHILGGDVGEKPTSEPPRDVVRWIGRVRYIALRMYGANSEAINLIDRLESLLCGVVE